MNIKYWRYNSEVRGNKASISERCIFEIRYFIKMVDWRLNIEDWSLKFKYWRLRLNIKVWRYKSEERGN